MDAFVNANKIVSRTACHRRMIALTVAIRTIDGKLLHMITGQ